MYENYDEIPCKVPWVLVTNSVKAAISLFWSILSTSYKNYEIYKLIYVHLNLYLGNKFLFILLNLFFHRINFYYHLDLNKNLDW